MSQAVYEFPLNEKVRTYLRLEQLFKQLKQGVSATENWQFIRFFDSLFTMLDLLERLDIRNDIIKDIDAQEKILVQWSEHPQIDTQALQETLQTVIRLRERIKCAKKIWADLREDRFLSSIRQRFSIPGGTGSFDLPNLHYWLNQPIEKIRKDVDHWLEDLLNLSDAIDINLSFMRERSKFNDALANKGFYQGVADEKSELIRIRCQTDQDFYPTLSGNKHRYAIRFMSFEPNPQGGSAIDNDVNFAIAKC